MAQGSFGATPRRRRRNRRGGSHLPDSEQPNPDNPYPAAQTAPLANGETPDSRSDSPQPTTVWDQPPTSDHDNPPDSSVLTDYDDQNLVPAPRQRITVSRVAAARCKELSGKAVRTVIAASRAGGAGESGLTKLIWTHAVQTAADAMIAVSLAGTIFFSAATSEQRTKVALYLLITMAPFALVAPILGPLLDRLQHGRRLALAGTMVGRAVLVYVMAVNFDNLALYPAAFGVLVLSKAYGVLRGACVPRLLPQKVTLVSANARLSIFGLALAAIAGGALGGFIKLTGSYPWALYLTMVVFLWCAVLTMRLPKKVDSSEAERAAWLAAGPGSGIFRVRQSLDRHTGAALRSASALRALTGFLTLFMAFLIQQREHGFASVLSLGAVAGAAAIGSFSGTAAGARLRLSKPDNTVLVCIGSAAIACVLAAISYGIPTVALVALVVGFTNALAKLCLDSIIQREVPDGLRASVFGRSETALQFAWVIGGGIGIALPSNGPLGFGVATALMAGAFILALKGRRRALAGAPDPIGKPGPKVSPPVYGEPTI